MHIQAVHNIFMLLQVYKWKKQWNMVKLICAFLQLLVNGPKK